MVVDTRPTVRPTVSCQVSPHSVTELNTIVSIHVYVLLHHTCLSEHMLGKVNLRSVHQRSQWMRVGECVGVRVG